MDGSNETPECDDDLTATKSQAELKFRARREWEAVWGSDDCVSAGQGRTSVGGKKQSNQDSAGGQANLAQDRQTNRWNGNSD